MSEKHPIDFVDEEIKTVVHVRRMHIGCTELAALLYRANLLPDSHEGEVTVKAYVNVPGGGDWSHTQLDLKDHKLVVEITTVDTRKG